MGLYIAKKDPMNNYEFELTAVQHDLLSIAKFDMGVGEGNPIFFAGIECVPVTYNKSLTGATQDRLNVLVNNSGIDHGQQTSYFSPPHIIIAAVRNGYTLNDGVTTIHSALSLPPWISDPRNPFNDYCVFYNVQACAIDNFQMWVKDTAGGTIATNSALRLYHELAHCFEHANGGSISNETAAIAIENEMRDMLNVPHRDVNDSASGCGAPSPNVPVTTTTDPCFIGATPVLTADGWRPISELRVGERVISYDRSTGTTRIRHVKKHSRFPAARIWEIYLANRTEPIGTTRIHCFLTNRGWKQTKQLVPGDILTTSGQQEAVVSSIVETSRIEPVYSLLTDVEHTYIVHGCVVHNFTYLRSLRIWLHNYVLKNRVREKWNEAETCSN
jgi:Pretoxin HINT domain